MTYFIFYVIGVFTGSALREIIYVVMARRYSSYNDLLVGLLAIRAWWDGSEDKSYGYTRTVYAKDASKRYTSFLEFTRSLQHERD